MDSLASAAAGLLPVVAVLVVLLLTWLGTAAFGTHFTDRARRVPPGGGAVVPAQRRRPAGAQPRRQRPEGGRAARR